jgi:biopolymer transport protein ExbB
LTERFLQLALGGAEWVMWLLILLSVFSVYVMIERWGFLASVGGADAALRKPLRDALLAGDLAQANKLVKDAKGAGGRLVGEMLDTAERGEQSMAAVMAGQRPVEKLRLERNLAFLGTVGSNAPFIGLFGTVLGIIKAFKDLADQGVSGSDNSAVVMAGISEALVATAVGLMVAIPAVVAYNVFQRRVKNLLGEADALASSALALLIHGPGPAGEPSGSGSSATKERS